MPALVKVAKPPGSKGLIWYPKMTEIPLSTWNSNCLVVKLLCEALSAGEECLPPRLFPCQQGWWQAGGVGNLPMPFAVLMQLCHTAALPYSLFWDSPEHYRHWKWACLHKHRDKTDFQKQPYARSTLQSFATQQCDSSYVAEPARTLSIDNYVSKWVLIKP